MAGRIFCQYNLNLVESGGSPQLGIPIRVKALAQAARTGAKYAAIKGYIDSTVEQEIYDVLATAGIQSEDVVISGTSTLKAFGEPIEVSLEYAKTFSVFSVGSDLAAGMTDYALTLRARARTTSEYLPPP